jgi:LysM repeat protein
MSCRFHFALVASALIAGCNLASAQGVQDDDSSNQHFKAAQQDLDNNNPTAAATEYDAALAANPKLAAAHYELGLLYAEKLHDPISAIYHLKLFVALAPGSDHAATANQMISQQGRAFAASLPPEANAVDVNKLQAENADLKKERDDAARTITELQSQLAQAGAHRTADVPAPAASAPPAPSGPQRALPLDSTNVFTAPAAPGTPGTPAVDTANARSYTVVKGDSLWKIAHKMYPHDTKNGVDKIQEANKDAIGGKPLKIGQVLVIP